MKKLNEKELEQFIHATLRSLPNRKAPGTLEARILAAVEQRAAIPWWHKSWSYWPAAVRAVFLTFATGAAAFAVVAFYQLSQGVSTDAIAHEAGSRFQALAQIYAVGAWIVDFAARLFGHIPSLWIYGGLATIAALYATFFGLGAAAYRTLYRSR